MVSPSLIAAEFTCLERVVQQVSGADWLHLDVMDAHFVPNLTFGPLGVRAVRKLTRQPLDVHLMMTHPHHYLGAFQEAGADWLTVHVESQAPFPRVLEEIRSLGMRAGIALNPETPVDRVLPLVSHVDLVLVMSVHPGFSGQSFIPDVLQKVRTLRDYRESHNVRFLISIDGGINQDTAPLAAKAGVDVLVAGSYVFRGADPAERIRALQQLFLSNP
jgi:ribulose-phosphate 3-epimerase